MAEGRGSEQAETPRPFSDMAPIDTVAPHYGLNGKGSLYPIPPH